MNSRNLARKNSSPVPIAKNGRKGEDDGLSSAVSALFATPTIPNNFFIPQTVENYSLFSFPWLSKRLSSQLIVVVEELDGLGANHVLPGANIYLAIEISSLTQRIKVNKPGKDQDLEVILAENKELVDSFAGGFQFNWVLQQIAKGDCHGYSKRYFELSFQKKHKDLVLKAYLSYIPRKAKEIKEKRKVVKLHRVANSGTDNWSSVALKHPATFSTMAMDPKLKKDLIEDLDRFISRKDYYWRVGKAWKRGYLFYLGTGKFSLIAAMANYLKLDVYEFNLRQGPIYFRFEEVINRFIKEIDSCD